MIPGCEGAGGSFVTGLHCKWSGRRSRHKSIQNYTREWATFWYTRASFLWGRSKSFMEWLHVISQWGHDPLKPIFHSPNPIFTWNTGSRWSSTSRSFHVNSPLQLVGLWQISNDWICEGNGTHRQALQSNEVHGSIPSGEMSQNQISYNLHFVTLGFTLYHIKAREARHDQQLPRGFKNSVDEASQQFRNPDTGLNLNSSRPDPEVLTPNQPQKEPTPKLCYLKLHKKAQKTFFSTRVKN